MPPSSNVAAAVVGHQQEGTAVSTRNNNNNNNNNHQQRRRLVVYIGPLKTGSTSLQLFLDKHIRLMKKNGRPTHKAFKDWAYPRFFGEFLGLRRIKKGANHPDFKEIQRVFQNQPSSLNVIVALEMLIHYAELVDGKLFELFANWTGISKPEIVIHSRSPRTSHLFSVWKQETQVSIHKGRPWHKVSFHDYMCAEGSKEKARQDIELLLNPIGAAHDMVHNYGYHTHFVDMAGISKQKMDVSHAFACSILNVKCSEDNKWADGASHHAKHANAKKGNPKLTPKQIQQMENVFHRRDCAYQKDLYDHPLFNHLFAHNESWPNDCTNVKARPEYRQNGTLVVNELRRIMQCPGYYHARVEKRSTGELLKPTATFSTMNAVAFAALALILIMSEGIRRRKARN